MKYYIPSNKWDRAKWLSKYYIKRDFGQAVAFNEIDVPYFVDGFDRFEKDWMIGVFCSHHKIHKHEPINSVGDVYWAFVRKFDRKPKKQLYAIIQSIWERSEREQEKVEEKTWKHRGPVQLSLL